jgi:hypothetical protein
MPGAISHATEYHMPLDAAFAHRHRPAQRKISHQYGAAAVIGALVKRVERDTHRACNAIN